MKSNKPVKQKPCDNPLCKKLFTPEQFGQVVCDWKCGLERKRHDDKKKARDAEKLERKKLRERKEKLKSRGDFEQECQREFNKFIRLRDKDENCISCGRTEQELIKSGIVTYFGIWDCGHYLTVGAFPELRFEELNAHKQCKKCNGGSGNFSKKERTVSAEYKERLIKKIGIEKVEWLEGPHEMPKLTIEEIKEKTKYYRAKVKEMKCES